MTDETETTETVADPIIPTDPRNKRFAIAAASSVVLVVVVVVLTITLGIVHEPKFVTQASSPISGLTGKVAYSKSSSEDSKSCVHVVDVASAADKEITCIDGSISFSWLPSGQLVVGDNFSQSETTLLSIFDADGTKTKDTIEINSNFSNNSGTSYFSSETSSTDLKLAYSKAELKLGKNVLIHVDGPADYSFTAAQRSPDAKGYVLQDTNSRIILASADGKELRLLVDGSENDSGYGYGGNALGWFQDGHNENTTSQADIKAKGLNQINSPLSANPDYDF